jgi:lysophospholipase L1-like esterase
VVALVVVVGALMALHRPSTATTDIPAPPLPTGSAPAPVASPSAPLRQVHSVVALGDSVSAGAACSCSPFADLVGQDIAAHERHSVAVTNLSVGGATAGDLFQQLDAHATRSALASADLVLVTTGANDLEAQSPPDQSCADLAPACFRDALAALPATLDRIVTRVRSEAPARATVLLTGYWNVFLDGAVARGNGPAYVRNSTLLTRRVNGEIAAAAKKDGALYVDTYRLFRGDNDADDTPLLAADGDHPNAAGHRVIAAGIVTALRTAGVAA